ncbi:hypothetical protein GMDG_03189 [Pseudogymnoascus destructans 20631-21]|uniref:Myb-like domain-containing protein n=1 Tax=Pseudogymnoascus destructans (strain ATCC MYA-4855 / 20631-21) TaxID=658429 RepID=L8G550_PSED2|nr:hypothetical protein GMDG_03189 [Pseudogymnoascus destructans 20631-21]
MDGRHSSAQFCASKRPLLYPILENTVHLHQQPQIILPPIKDLHLPMYKSVNAQTQTQPELFQANHSQHQSSNSATLPSYAKPIHSYKHRSNKSYTADQLLFIQTERDAKNTPWKIVTEEYNKAFPGYYRSQSGLEARYYREQSETKGNTDSASRT